MPAWTNLDDDSVGFYNASAGIHSIALWVTGLPATPSLQGVSIEEQQGYYSATLLLLSKIAVKERGADNIKHFAILRQNTVGP